MKSGSVASWPYMSGIMLPLQLSEASSRDTASSAAVEAAPANLYSIYWGS